MGETAYLFTWFGVFAILFCSCVVPGFLMGTDFLIKRFPYDEQTRLGKIIGFVAIFIASVVMVFGTFMTTNILFYAAARLR